MSDAQQCAVRMTRSKVTVKVTSAVKPLNGRQLVDPHGTNFCNIRFSFVLK